MNNPGVVIMAGGTGGHVFPGLAVAKCMLDKGWDVQWIGSPDKMEAQLVPRHNIPIHFINIGGVRGKSGFTKLLAPVKLIKAMFQAIKLLRKLKPNAVLGMGGYVSGPGALAARILNIPIVVHEQNAVFGLTNRYVAKFADFTLTGFDLRALQQKHSAMHLPKNTHHVGNPIRQGFFDINVKQATQNADLVTQALDNAQLDRSKAIVEALPINILIVGGSLGALALNQIVPGVLVSLGNKYHISVVHQAGKGKHVQAKEAYKHFDKVEVLEFIDDMESMFSWADIIICRAGALTVAEVAGAGRVAIFVPLPIAVDDHQTANAKYLSEKGAAILIQQSELAKKLPLEIEALCMSPKKRIEMSTIAKTCAYENASADVAKFIEKAAKPYQQKEAM